MVSAALKGWTKKDSAELYNIENWGSNFYSVNGKGHVQISNGLGNGGIDIKELVDDLIRRDINPPMILRFSDILKSKVDEINLCFHSAIKEYDYKGDYRAVFPIKTNQQKQITESVIKFGEPYKYGLEAGSKAEFIAAIAMINSEESIIICNGYKDYEYIELALYAQKMGLSVIPVVEKFSEIDLIIDLSKKLNIKPRFGVRSKLSTTGTGRWEGSGGDKSKFGLSVTELLSLTTLLEEKGLLDSFVLLHFHLGSQISNIRKIKEAIEEASRIYVELSKKGAGLRYIDVGGGLGVDYDGSKTVFASSINYTMQEYANDIVAGIMAVLDSTNVAHPTIISESGRAIVAHHSVVIIKVLGTVSYGYADVPLTPSENLPGVIETFYEIYNSISRKNFQEAYHDAIHAREEALTLFKLGYLSLEMRSLSERIFWGICKKILKIVRELEYVPEEFEGLEKAMSDTYFCNFSVFQSVPDCWAIQHLFPVMPIHRLNEEPAKKAVIADITCDSDGKIDRFIDLHDVKYVLDVHPLNGEPYYLGIFMTGAYQETLGDLHNLFGDINAVHVKIDPAGGYIVEHVVEGESVREVLSYVDYQSKECLQKLRCHLENAVRKEHISLEESAEFMRIYERGMEGYTYLGNIQEGV